MTSVLVSPSGPPWVISQITSKRRSDHTVMSRVSRATEGRMVGQVTARKMLSRSAPSITAASRSSDGTP
ncbi:hypothetical protein D3C71_2054100 [compost metagenome]